MNLIISAVRRIISSRSQTLFWLDDDLNGDPNKHPYGIEQILEENGYFPQKYSDVGDALQHFEIISSKIKNPVILLDIKLPLPKQFFKNERIDISANEFDDALMLKEVIMKIFPQGKVIFLSNFADEARERWSQENINSNHIIEKGLGNEFLINVLKKDFKVPPITKNKIRKGFTKKSNRKEFVACTEIATLRGQVESIADNIAYVRVDIDGDEHIRIFDLTFLKKTKIGYQGAPVVIHVYEYSNGSLGSKIEFDVETEKKRIELITSKEVEELEKKLSEYANPKNNNDE